MPDAPTHKLAAQQARFNRSTRGHWEHFASHRERVEQLLVADGLGGSGRLCVLGAGNCNDLDLRQLGDVFAEVHLVDLDPPALAGATRRQGVADSPKVKLHVPVDLTGVADVMAAWPGRRVPPGEIAACLRRVADAPLPQLGGPFDVVLSPCVLSQIVGYANDTLGRDHPRTPALRLALRDRHLRLMVDQVAPGRWSILVTDLASSASVEGLERRRHDELPDLLRRLVGSGRTFPGLDPDAVMGAVRADPLTGAQVSAIEFVRPWLWKLGPMKTFLVHAVRLRKSAGAVVIPGASPRPRIWTP